MVRDVDATWDLLWKHIVEIWDKHCPYISFTVQTKPDYITDDMLAKMRKRDSAFKKAHKSKIPDLLYAKNLGQELTQELRKAKRKFILLQMDLTRGNSKMFWDIIYKNFQVKTENVMEQVCDDSNDTLLQGYEAAEFINNYFCNIGYKLASKFGSGQPDCTVNSSPHPDWIWEPNITTVDVHNMIKEIDVKKSFRFHSKLLKHSLLCLTETFKDLLNACIRTCISQNTGN